MGRQLGRGQSTHPTLHQSAGHKKTQSHVLRTGRFGRLLPLNRNAAACPVTPASMLHHTQYGDLTNVTPTESHSSLTFVQGLIKIIDPSHDSHTRTRCLSHRLFGGSFLPSTLARLKSFFARPSLALHPPGAMAEQCPKQCAPRSAGSVGSGGPGKVSSCCPRGDSASCFVGFISRVLIIAAPGGIVPYYYTVDLYLIRHHMKPSAPSWHPCSCRISPASTCPLLYYSCINQATVSGQNQSSFIFIQQRPVNLETPRAGRQIPTRQELRACPWWQRVPAIPPSLPLAASGDVSPFGLAFGLLPIARAAQRSPPHWCPGQQHL